MRLLDDRVLGAEDALRDLYPNTGNARIVGITGNPGSGKSTLVGQLISIYRKQGLKVGIVCVDPSSPFSGGAILGDRIRMMEHATDPGVFIHSLATRGQLGGLSRSTDDVVHVMDAMGYDRVIIETVGVGQDEIDIVRTAQTAVVVMVPGLGDDIQAIKAGVLEIADIFVVNKADRDGARRTMADLKTMQHLISAPGEAEWEVPVLETVAIHGKGIAPLVDVLDAHYAHLSATDGLGDRQRTREAQLLRNVLQDRFAQRLEAVLAADDLGETLVQELIARTTDPYSAADRVLEQILIRD
ncbi:MAG: LAO/AO transport system kinase [Myxococcota bacterium]|jgi:LAO/AO transport system kinase